MRTLKQIGRVLLILIAVIVMVILVAAIAGTWYANNTVSDVTLRVFALAETGVSIAETGVNRVDGLVKDGRTEVQQAEETIETVGGNLQENRPVLTALQSRLQTRLGPTVDTVQQGLAPVRDALVTVANVVEIANAIPGVQQRSPRLAQLDQTFTDLEQMAADVKQLDDTLRSSVVDQQALLTQEAVNTLTGLTTRIDDGLAQVEAAVAQVMEDVNALQDDLLARKARLLLIYDLTALVLTLLLLWLIYSQIVVIRHQWRAMRTAPAAAAPAAPEPEVPPATTYPSVEPEAAPTPVETLDELETEVEPEASAAEDTGEALSSQEDMPDDQRS